MVTLEAENLQLVVVVEIDVELPAVAKETAAVEVIPYGLHEMDAAYLFIMIFNDGIEVAVKAKSATALRSGRALATMLAPSVDGKACL